MNILFPGLGLIYAMGPKSVPVLLVAYFCLFTLPHAGTYVFAYFALSLIGTSHIKGPQLENNRWKQLQGRDDIISPEKGTQVPLARNQEFYEQKHKAKLAKKMHGKHHDDDDHSDHATDLFEAKAHAAELQLKARALQEGGSGSEPAAQSPFDDSAAIDFRPADAPTFDDDNPDKSGADSSVPSPAVAADSSGTAAATGASLTSGKGFNDPSFSRPFGDGLPTMDLSADAPSVVPDVLELVASSESVVPDVSTQYSAAALPMPDAAVTATSVNAGTGTTSGSSSVVPDVSTQFDNKPIVVPDVNAQWQNKPIEAPDVSVQSQPADSNADMAQWQRQKIEAPDMTQWERQPIAAADMTQWERQPIAAADMTQWQRQTIEEPDMSQWQSKPAEAPTPSAPVLSSASPAQSTSPDPAHTFDFSSSSVGQFEIPKFEFSFQDPMLSTSLPAAGSASGAATEKCPKCGELKNSNFSFCLTCGQTF